MATVKELLAGKDGGLLVTAPDTTVLDAAEQMNSRGTGSVLVMRRDAGTTALRDVMTTALVTCTPDATTSDCGALMSERRIRHLPVIDGKQVLGVITTGDLLAHEFADGVAEALVPQLVSERVRGGVADELLHERDAE